MSAAPSTATELAVEERAGALPRLLLGVPERGPMTLAEHQEVHGPLPAEHGRGRRWARGRGERLVEEIARAGLLGRGGAGFPTARKMQAVAAARGRAIVLANGAEGEPASQKDHTLLELLPHVVLDGAVTAAEAVDADEAIIAVCELARDSGASVAQAIEEREASPAHARRGPRLRLVTVPGHYVAGQESALVNYLSGGPAKPMFTPPMPFERGVGRRPTLISNVETLAHAALIVRHGAPWFRELGTASQPGSALVTLSGPVAYPGVYEVELGASLASLIEPPAAHVAGCRGRCRGYSGSWIGAEHLSTLALSDEYLAPHGATVGAGVVALLSERACPVAEVTRLSRWLANQSTRQCGPCVHGLDALARTVGGPARDRGCRRQPGPAPRSTRRPHRPPRGLRAPGRRGQDDLQRAADVRRRVRRTRSPRFLRSVRAAVGAAPPGASRER